MKTKVKVKTTKEPKKLEKTSSADIVKNRSEREKILIGDIEKKFGQGLIGRAGDIGYRSIPRLSTGVFALDVALGGGWAKGRVNLVWGPQSSCKTYLMLKMIASAQQHDFYTNLPLSHVEDGKPYKIAYIDVEGALDFDWAQKLGVDLSELYYVRPEHAEQAADIVESLMASGVFDIIVLDSLAAMTPEKEMEGDMGDQTVGTHARINNKMFRKIQSVMNKISNEDGHLTPSLFVINQEREKIGVMFGSNKIKPGGRGQDFYTTMEVHTHSHKMEYFDTEKTLPKHAHFSFKVEKNKAAPPKIEGQFILAVADDPEGTFEAGDVMEDVTIHNYSERLGLFKKIDSTTWEMCGKIYKRKGDLLAEWYQDHGNRDRLKRQMLQILFPKVFAHVQEKRAEGRSVEGVENKAEEQPAATEIGSQDSQSA
jgi:recombination protein RecA